ncbi:DUF4878 domain-containing protein [Vreelandella venusta]|uniref:DUF4878 domain-containing protein n=1 Tax=Halomonadaceae TaxID=28256 RepID=UPI00264A205D|nr:DUF4878 domain-containing protein [Halomonas sp. KG2]WKD29585.1 DUF4878 domain-containing protein [Halomonas sp. KG2]
MKNHLLYPLLLLLAVFTLTACSGGKPEDTVETFFKAAAQGDTDKAIDQISFASVSANEMVQARGKVQMIVGEVQNRINANDGFDSVETLNSVISDDGNQATIQSQINYGNGKSTTENTRLVKIDGDWKISLD